MGKPWENATKLDPICHINPICHTFLQFHIFGNNAISGRTISTAKRVLVHAETFHKTDKPSALGESDCESLRTSGGFMIFYSSRDFKAGLCPSDMCCDV